VSTVHVVLPNDIDDPRTPSGGNSYDRQVCRGLAASGWSVPEHPVAGDWPSPDRRARAELAGVLAGLPAGAVVLLDGLIASTVPDLLAAQSDRLRLAVLVHLPLGDETASARAGEGRALASAVSIITTSDWARHRLLDLYPLAPDRVHVARPGVTAAPLAGGCEAGSSLLCVAAVTEHKGQHRLIEALATVAELPWRCLCVGSLTREPDYVQRVRRRVGEYRLAGRVHLAGPRTSDQLAAAYAAADLLVLASRGETYGMVVTEALARGVPVLATAANGLPEALGRAPDGSRPGLLVEPDDPVALAGALRRWLTDAALRHRLRRSAAQRRETLTGWQTTAQLISHVLHGVPAIPGGVA
jgi:glycosyltransferase involved in cell wall biosynthesis